MAATATATSLGLALHRRDHDPRSNRRPVPSSSLASTSAFRSRRAKCSCRVVPPPSAAAGDLEGNEVLAEGHTLKQSLSNEMLPSSSTKATSSMADHVSLSSLHHHPNSQSSCFATSKPNHDNTHKYNQSPQIPRRSLVMLPASSLLLSASSSFAIDDTKAPSPSTIDTTITDRIFMDFSICPSFFSNDRTLGAELASCPDSEPLGRVVFGLYGRLLPITTTNFKTTCTASAYRGTLVHKVLQGQFFAAGRQGSRRDKGVVQPPSKLVRNVETVDPKAYQLRHARPGTLSLCLEQNDDDDSIKLSPNYHNVEFLVTTGPGPCPDLDGQNIVFGTVLEGMDVITSIATIPTYKPGERIQLFNDFAQLIGDERAQSARAMWDRPQKTVYISGCGELKVTKPSLSPPSLP
ncbi:Peptidyl-prolyl cis-trans isomerase B [Hordeum vulgare]|uniref:PPIase cyclophilin-type domain-containing protein n=2 Tax=Hordeum vulgare subsp. vulgare TaxID=112509 RepID=A0A8I6Z7C5_HORVV|nr:peptidyl-prolyl cis-trans isomerase CYP28, chloroplastic isoform X1 [Hordeum vulgare subsp. vulgare]KAE8806800.1 Peptidyl-prolyl cis-trans isomerase B [Hordeum vulgare]